MIALAHRFGLVCGVAAGLCVFATSATAVAQQGEPAPPQARQQQSDRPGASDKNKKDDDEHFRIGPMVGIGFPRPLEIEGFVKFEKLVGVGFEYGFMPKTTIMGAETTFKGIAADLRIFPFKGAFFIGARAGHQWLDAKTTVTVNNVNSFNESMEASTWFINPRIGFLYTWKSGITVGIDAGVQIPISPTYQRSGALTDSGLASHTNIDQTLTSVAGALGNNVTPTIDLLRVGFLF